MKRRIWGVILMLLLSVTLFSVAASAAEETFAVDVSYDEPLRCGEPAVFTVNVAGADPDQCKYYLSYVDFGAGADRVLVADPSVAAWPKYQASNTFEFTFYASGVYSLKFYAMDMSVTPRKLASREIVITINDEDYPTLAERSEAIVRECEEHCATEYDKAIWLHDWLVEHCKYDSSYLYCHAEGALARGTGTCEAYHQAYCMLLDEAGIENGRIEGNGHVWTAVKIDGSWCQVDVTWDDDGYSDSYSDNHYLYFGLNDAITAKVHSDHVPREGYTSDTLENNYFIRTGRVSQWSDGFVEEIREKIAAGETSFSVKVSSSEPESLLDVKYALAAYDLSKRVTEDADGNPCAVECAYADHEITVEVLPLPIVPGWKEDTAGRRYLNEDGTYVTSAFQTIDDARYYFDAEGYMVTGWKKIESARYYFNADGCMAVGWKKIGKYWYYFSKGGVMQASGWISGTYYLQSNGRMAVSEWVDGGKYYVDSKGKWVKEKARPGQWVKDASGWRYRYDAGGYASSVWYRIDGVRYYFNAKGYMVTGWKKIGKYWYYFSKGGAMQSSKWISGLYYVKSDGKMAVSEWVDGGKYYVDANGKWVKGKTREAG